MPAGTIESFRIYQWGKETVRGTLVPATSKIAVDNLELKPVDTLHRPKLAKGLGHRNPASETVVRRGTNFTVPLTEVIYDQMQNWCSMSVVGGQTPTGAGPYLWTFARSLTADPAPDTWTIERRLTDGTTARDFRWAYAFLSEISWHYQIDKPLMFEAKGFARRVQTNALTASQTLPTIEIPPAPLARLYIDGTWANLGVTQILTQLVRAKVTFKTGLKPKWTFDGRSDLDWSTYVFDARECGVDAELDMLWSSEVDAEKTAAEAATVRAVRLDVSGTGSRELRLDMLVKHQEGSIFDVTSEDGQDLVRMKLEDTDDGTNMFRAFVENSVATLV